MNALEINKKIAKLKCYKVLYEHYNAVRVSADSLHDVKIEEPQNAEEALMAAGFQMIAGRVFNWAESISDAWELFEEMPGPSIFKLDNQTIEFYKKSEAEQINRDKIKRFAVASTEGGIRSFADTAPLAICLAWIKCKEQ